MTKTTRHDTDGQAYLAYYRKDHVLGFVWDGNIEHPIQVQHEMGEPIHDTLELGGPSGGYILPTAALFGVFKEACDHYADTGPTYDTSLDPISPDFDARTWEAPAKPKVSLNVTCEFRVPERPLGHRLSGSRSCREPAVALIVTRCYGDESEFSVYPLCADHAPEEVHETRCSMAEDEFLVVTLPVDDYPEVPTPETWPVGTRLHAGDSWGTVDEWQGRTVWRIKWDNGTSFTGAACSGYGKGN